jgi:membrane-associated protease RseP (regulator of RpoE activity)
MKEPLVFIIFVLLLLGITAGYSYGTFSFDLTTFLAFILIVGLLIYRDRRKLKLQGIVLMRRTTKGRNFINSTANRHRTMWKTLGIIGVVIAIPTLILGSVFLINQAFSIAAGEKEGGVRLLLPGPVSAPTSLPGMFVVPWWIWVIGVASVIIPHEFMHGIMCRLDKIRIKSVGWILLVIIPGAFVEPDEKQLQKARRSTKLKVYAAGSFANIFTAFVVLAVLMIYFSTAFSSAGIFVQTIQGGPAEQAGLKGTIIAIDSQPVRTQEDIRAILSRYNPGDAVYVSTIGGDLVIPSFTASGWDFFIPKPAIVTEIAQNTANTYTITLAEHPERGGAYMGVSPVLKSYSFAGSQADFFVYQNISMLLMWIFVFSLGVGIVNILPIKPLDGGLLFEEIVGKFTPRTKFVVQAVSGVMLLVLLFNLVGPVLV